MSRTTISPWIKAQVEKLNALANGGQQSIYSSSPIIILKKPTRSNTSSQSSSSYTSVADQMSSMDETSLQLHRDLDDVSYTSLPMLSSTCQRLEHSAARDRIAVKNKRRQPIKEKLSTLRETDNNQIDILFSSTSDDDEQTTVVPQIESKVPQPIVELADLDAIRTRLRVTNRQREHSADNIISTTPIVSTYVSSVKRSISFKRPQEITQTKFINRSRYQIEKNENEDENEEQENKLKSSTKEHIYDNLDLFKRHKINIQSNLISNQNEFLTRERLRPVSMHIPSINDQQTSNEFENVFNQLKKRASIKKLQSKQESISIQTLVPSINNEETSTSSLIENEPIVPVVISPIKKLEKSSIIQSSNRRKTVGGVHLMTNNKVAVDDNKPTPSWIDIAKQKQNKFQSISIENNHHEESKQQNTSIESVLLSEKQILTSSNNAIIKENTSEDIRSNRKSLFEPIVLPRTSPPIVSSHTHGIERDSIRALKAGNPNRINNLIQFFDK